MSGVAERTEFAAYAMDQLAEVQHIHDKEPQNTQFKNGGEYAEWRIRSKLGLYPQDHPISQYAQQLLERVGGAPDTDRPRLTVYKGAPNAFVFPGGSVYLSDQLLNLADTEEEVLFVLGHERIHHQEAHSEKVFKRTEDQEKSLREMALGVIGQSRINEWESDLRAFDELDRLGINPTGGITLMEKFRTNPRLAGGGLVHGKSADRALNLRAMTYAKDLASIDQPMHAIPSEIKAAIAQDQRMNEFSSKYDQLVAAMAVWGTNRSLSLVNSMDLDNLFVALPDLIEIHKSTRGKSDRPGDRNDNDAIFQRGVIQALAAKTWERLSQTPTAQDRNLSERQVTLLYYTVLSMVDGIDINEAEKVIFNPAVTVSNSDLGTNLPWTKENFSLTTQIQSMDDLEQLVKVLDPSLFKELGLRFNTTPEGFVAPIIQSAMDNFVFEDNDQGEFDPDLFLSTIRNLAQHINTLYAEYGATPLDLNTIHQTAIEIACKGLDKPFADALLEKAKSLPEISFDTTAEENKEEEQVVRLIELCKKYGLDYKNQVIGLTGERDREISRNIRHLNPEATAQYRSQIQEILKNMEFDNPHDLLVFLAEFRKGIQEDRNSWDMYNFSDDAWTDLLNGVIQEENSSKWFTTDPVNETASLDAIKFNLKIGLLLAYDPASNIIIEPSSELLDTLENPGFNLEYYKSLYKLISSPDELAKETGVDVTTASLTDPNANSSWTDFLKSGKYLLLNQFLQSSSREEFRGMLTLLTDEFPLNHYGTQDTTVDGGVTYFNRSVWSKRRLLNEIFKKYSFNLENKDELNELYYLSTYFEDHSLAVRLQNVIWEKLVAQSSFEEGFTFLEREIRAKRLLSLKAVSDFIETKAQTHDQIEMAGQRLVALATQDSSMEGVGRLVLAEQFTSRFFDNKLDLLLAAIGNGEDDSMLKRYLYKRWVPAFDADRDETAYWVHLNDLEDKLYGLDAQSKYVLIRDLLTGDKGVLTDKDINKRLQFVDLFLDNYVQITGDSDRKMFGVIKEVVQEVVRTANYDLLYFALAPILQERVLLPPSRQTDWREIVLSEEPPKAYDADGDIPDEWDGNEKNRRWVLRHKEDAEEIVAFINGEVNVGQDDDNFSRESEQVRREYEQTIRKLVGGLEAPPRKAKMTVNEFLLETAQRLGAPGVRFLQLIGQYVDLPPELEESFNAVYDKVGGQSKITADQTLLREWPDARTALEGLEDRLGGGSLMSVFEALTQEGQLRAIKIMNPNAAFHTETTHKLLTAVFTTLAEKNPDFAPALTLLEDIREWIRNDIDFTGFLEADAKFKRKHEGYTDGGRYKIRVPTSYEPENKFFATEDYIEGVNLTDLPRLQEQGHDLKQIIRLLTKNFFEQVKDGQVHSDIHPGNIRITPSDEVTLLDRNYYLDFSFGDRFFLWTLYQSLDNIQGATNICLNYMGQTGVQIDGEQRQKIMAEVGSMDESADPVNKLMKMAVLFRKEKLRFPPKITLLIKDIFYLDRMAKRVGYSGISEASQS